MNTFSICNAQARLLSHESLYYNIWKQCSIQPSGCVPGCLLVPQRPLKPVRVQDLWGVDPVLQFLRKKRRFEPATVERVYEADVYPCTFDFKAWKQHRSRSRYFEHMITLFRSYLLKDLTGPLLNATSVAVVVAVYNLCVQQGVAPEGWTTAHSAWEPFSLMSFALSLMLVFRTNSSYARWVEARALWGQLVNGCRSLVRQVLSTFPPAATEQKLAVARWTVAFAKVSKMHLREGGDVQAELAGVLLPQEIDLVASADNRPTAALQVISQILATVPGLDSSARMRIEEEISGVQMCIGSCEKILRNPIPLSYTRHTARFLVIWLWVLPLSLWDRLGLGVIPTTAVVAYLLLGIDEIAIQLEEPFGILPLESLCDTVQRNVKEQLDQEQRVRDMVRLYNSHPPHKNFSGRGHMAPPGWAQPPACSFATMTGSDTEDDEGQSQHVMAGTNQGDVFGLDDEDNSNRNAN